jgi:2-polyprenyl-3-methyl-5-hydroxy-6-metoxy-1,4-benzoquinol methylase
MSDREPHNSDLEPHNRVQRAYFEDRELPRMVPADTRSVRRHVQAVTLAAGLRPGERVLDAGCGLGRCTIPLARLGIAVEGLDLNAALVQQIAAHAGGESIPTHVGDMCDPPDGLHGGFDAVVGFFALHHLSDLRRAFEGVRALLRPGGRVAFAEPNPFNPLYYVQITATPGMSWRGDGGIVRMRRSIVGPAMSAAGFVPERTVMYGFFPPAIANRGVGAAVEERFERLTAIRRFLPFQVFSGRLGRQGS